MFRFHKAVSTEENSRGVSPIPSTYRSVLKTPCATPNTNVMTTPNARQNPVLHFKIVTNRCSLMCFVTGALVIFIIALLWMCFSFITFLKSTRLENACNSRQMVADMFDEIHRNNALFNAVNATPQQNTLTIRKDTINITSADIFNVAVTRQISDNFRISRITEVKMPVKYNLLIEWTVSVINFSAIISFNGQFASAIKMTLIGLKTEGTLEANYGRINYTASANRTKVQKVLCDCDMLHHIKAQQPITQYDLALQLVDYLQHIFNLALAKTSWPPNVLLCLRKQLNY